MLLNILSKKNIIKLEDYSASNQSKILICLYNSQIKKISEILPYFKKIIFINNDIENLFSSSLLLSSTESIHQDNNKILFYSESNFLKNVPSNNSKKNEILSSTSKNKLSIEDSDEIIIFLDSILYKFGRNERNNIFTTCKSILTKINSNIKNKLIILEPVKGTTSSSSYSTLGYYTLLKEINQFFRTSQKKNNTLVDKKKIDDNNTILNSATITNLLESLDFQIEQRDVILNKIILKEQSDKNFNYNYLEQVKKRLLSFVGTDKRAVEKFSKRIIETIDNVISYEKSLTHYSWYPFLSVTASFQKGDEDLVLDKKLDKISYSYKSDSINSKSTTPNFITPREKLLTGDTEQLSIQELVSVIIGMGSKSEDVYTLSNRIIREYGSKALAEERSPKKLQEVLSIGEVNACKLVATFELGRRFYSNKILNRKLIRGPEDVFEYAKDMSTLVKENFRGLFLNSKNYIIHDEIISIGHLTASLVHPREVFKSAIEYSAAGIIVLHNHPSGDPEPSENDKKITKTLVETGKILNIPVLDHIIIGDEKYYSFNDNGALKKKEIR